MFFVRPPEWQISGPLLRYSLHPGSLQIWWVCFQASWTWSFWERIGYMMVYEWSWARLHKQTHKQQLSTQLQWTWRNASWTSHILHVLLSGNLLRRLAAKEVNVDWQEHGWYACKTIIVSCRDMSTRWSNLSFRSLSLSIYPVTDFDPKGMAFFSLEIGLLRGTLEERSPTRIGISTSSVQWFLSLQHVCAVFGNSGETVHKSKGWCENQGRFESQGLFLINFNIVHEMQSHKMFMKIIVYLFWCITKIIVCCESALEISLEFAWPWTY